VSPIGARHRAVRSDTTMILRTRHDTRSVFPLAALLLALDLFGLRAAPAADQIDDAIAGQPCINVGVNSTGNLNDGDPNGGNGNVGNLNDGNGNGSGNGVVGDGIGVGNGSDTDLTGIGNGG